MPPKELLGLEALDALGRLLGKIAVRGAIDYRGKTACFSGSKIDETDLPGIKTTALSSAPTWHWSNATFSPSLL